MTKDELPEEDLEKGIEDWVKHLKFRRKLFGGVDEDDVLKKMDELNSLYEKVLLQERKKYQSLLEQARGRGGRDSND